MSTTVLEPGPVQARTDSATPSPARFFDVMHAYQRTEAMKTAIELELFTAIGQGQATAAQFAQRVGASERGIRALCDFLVVNGFLTKAGNYYGLTMESSIFLDKKSEGYIGSAAGFLASNFATDGFRDLTGIVRAGGPLPGHPDCQYEDPLWVDFARNMAPVMCLVAQETEKFLRTTSPVNVLDIAAGHGLFGIAIARHNPKARIVAVDFPSVLKVAQENADRFGITARHTTIPGDAREVNYGEAYDIALVTNLLHQWNRETIGLFLKKVHAALAPKGRIAIVDFTPNDDRVSPPIQASFVMNMLACTTGGDVYTVSEYQAMLSRAGFSPGKVYPLPPTPHTLVIGVKE
jgi:2-polyprenyl-3-methyl-5-hydroxy-6-metoxy-1,4-benzoquinol methylase